jgi:hypothetical protein
MISIKIHQSEPKIIAMCDAELLGKAFENEKMQIDINEKFYKDKLMTEAQVIALIRKMAEDYCSFNIVGKKAVGAAIKAGIVNERNVICIEKIPIALVFNL